MIWSKRYGSSGVWESESLKKLPCLPHALWQLELLAEPTKLFESLVKFLYHLLLARLVAIYCLKLGGGKGDPSTNCSTGNSRYLLSDPDCLLSGIPFSVFLI